MEQLQSLIWGMREYLTIYEEAVSHIWLWNWIFLNMRKILLFFLSVQPYLILPKAPFKSTLNCTLAISVRFKLKADVKILERTDVPQFK